MRRAMSRLTPEELAAYAEQNSGQPGPRRVGVQQGVPVHIVTSFPTFAYHAAEFEASRESRQQVRGGCEGWCWCSDGSGGAAVL